MDGSGRPFVTLLRQAGIRNLRRKRRYLCIRREVSVEAPGKRITIYPADRFLSNLRYLFRSSAGGPTEASQMEVTPERYATDIAPARTFGFAWELDQMRNMGLIRGATLENAVCFDRDRRHESGRDCASRTSAAATRSSI